MRVGVLRALTLLLYVEVHVVLSVLANLGYALANVLTWALLLAIIAALIGGLPLPYRRIESRTHAKIYGASLRTHHIRELLSVLGAVAVFCSSTALLGSLTDHLKF
jgi:hypothetical protein